MKKKPEIKKKKKLQVPPNKAISMGKVFFLGNSTT